MISSSVLHKSCTSKEAPTANSCLTSARRSATRKSRMPQWIVRLKPASKTSGKSQHRQQIMSKSASLWRHSGTAAPSAQITKQRLVQRPCCRHTPCVILVMQYHMQTVHPWKGILSCSKARTAHVLRHLQYLRCNCQSAMSAVLAVLLSVHNTKTAAPVLIHDHRAQL